MLVMLIRTGMLSSVAMLLVGCSASTAPDIEPTEKANQPAAQNQYPDGYADKNSPLNVTFYLAGMNQELKIL